MNTPDLVATEYAMESAIWFFNKNNVWKHCNVVNDEAIEAVSKIINGGTHGLPDRKNQTQKIYKWLASD